MSDKVKTWCKTEKSNKQKQLLSRVDLCIYFFVCMKKGLSKKKIQKLKNDKCLVKIIWW